MKIWNWIKNNPNRTMFIVPIVLVAVISISHVVSWYDIMNPHTWAIYLSIAIEIGAMTALVAATNKIKGGVWVMFGLVTFIQMLGNIFFSYKEIDVNGDLFKSWMELTSPVWEFLGSDVNDTIAHKRWLAFLGGGLLPIISLTSLHFFIKYENPNKNETDDNIDLKKKSELNEEISPVFNETNDIENVTTTTTYNSNLEDLDVELFVNTYVKESPKIDIEVLALQPEDNDPILEIEPTQPIEVDDTTIQNTSIEETFVEEITTTTTTENKRVLSYTKE